MNENHKNQVFIASSVCQSVYVAVCVLYGENESNDTFSLALSIASRWHIHIYNSKHPMDKM